MTLLGLGSFPAGHSYSLGMMGMHGSAPANYAIQNADLVLAFGMRFDDRVTGTLHTYAPRAKKIHIDIDASEFNKNVKVDVPMLGDLKAVLSDLTPMLEEVKHPEWLQQIQSWKEESNARDILYWEQNGKLHAAHVVHDFWKQSYGEAVVTTGYNRGRSTSDVDCAVLYAGKTISVDHLRWCRNDGLRHTLRIGCLVRQ